MYCTHCGTPLNDDAQFCSMCGNSRYQKKHVDQVQAPMHVQPVAQPHAAYTPSSQAASATKHASFVPATVQSSFGTMRQSASAALQRVAQPENGWKPATTPELGGAPRYIKTNRSTLLLVLLSLLTFGLYTYYFVYQVAQDMNTMCDDDDQHTGGMLMFILLGFVTFGLYALYWWYKITDRAYLNAPRFGMILPDKGASVLFWFIVGFFTFGLGTFIALHKAVKSVNLLATAYNTAHGFTG